MSSLDSEAKPDNAGHSVLALTTSHSLVVSSPETFLPDMRKELGIIADLVESYNDELCLLKLMAVQFKTHNHQKLYSYLSGYNHCCGQLKLATALEFFQYRFSDSFGGNPPLYSCGLSAL